MVEGPVSRGGRSAPHWGSDPGPSIPNVQRDHQRRTRAKGRMSSTDYPAPSGGVCLHQWSGKLGGVVTELGAEQRERLLRDARRAFEGPIRRLADHGHVPRDEYIEAVRAVTRGLIEAGLGPLVYSDEMWRGLWDLEKVTDYELAAWGLRLVAMARDGIEPTF
jgi:hypothetical protein